MGLFDSGAQTSDSEIPFALRLMMVGNALQGFGGRGGGQGGGGNASIIQSIMEQRQQSAEQAKKQKFLESYAANIDDPKLRQAILSGMIDPGELFKQDFELKKQQAGADQALNLEKWKHENDPNTQMFNQLFGGVSAGTGAGGATSSGAPVQGPATPEGAGPMELTPQAGGVVDPFVARARKQFNMPDLTRDQAIELGTAAAKGELPAALRAMRESSISASKATSEAVAKGIESNIAREEFQGVSGAIGTPPKPDAPAAEWEAFAQGVSNYAGFRVSPRQAQAFSAYRSLEKQDKYLDDLRPKVSGTTVNVNPAQTGAGVPSNWVQMDKPNTDGSTTYHTGVNPDGSPNLVTIMPQGSKAEAEVKKSEAKAEGRKNTAKTSTLRRIQQIDRLDQLAEEFPDAFGPLAQTGISNIDPNSRNAFIEARGTMTSVASQITKEELQHMRDNSETGGAVGQVTEGEWARLASMQSALAAEGQNYDAKTFRRLAQEYRTALYDVANGTNYSGVYPEYNEKMPGPGPESGMRVSPDGNVKTQTTAPEPGTVKGGYIFKGGDPADEANWVEVK